MEWPSAGRGWLAQCLLLLCYTLPHGSIPAPLLRPAAGSATLAWSFMLLSSKGSQIGSSARPIPAASINGTGTVAKPHTALLSLPSDVLRSGAVFKVKLTAALTSPGVTASAASAVSPEFGLGERQALRLLILVAHSLLVQGCVWPHVQVVPCGPVTSCTLFHTAPLPACLVQGNRSLPPSPKSAVAKMR